ncbi:hypothetical protein [Streptomyces sp. NPDC055107]
MSLPLPRPALVADEALVNRRSGKTPAPTAPSASEELLFGGELAYDMFGKRGGAFLKLGPWRMARQFPQLIAIGVRLAHMADPPGYARSGWPSWGAGSPRRSAWSRSTACWATSSPAGAPTSDCRARCPPWRGFA